MPTPTKKPVNKIPGKILSATSKYGKFDRKIAKKTFRSLNEEGKLDAVVMQTACRLVTDGKLQRVARGQFALA